MIHADDFANGNRREWKHQRRKADVDALAIMEDAWQNLNSSL